MPLCHFSTAINATPRLGWVDLGGVYDLSAWEGAGLHSLRDVLSRPWSEVRQHLQDAPFDQLPVCTHVDAVLHKPIDAQEVWACGVTYLRSRDARMEESSEQSVYDRVYGAERPEIFFKATPSRVLGPGQPLAIRPDSTWDVPEPELALVINSMGEIVGYTIGNDVSSRSIEGENPLYLPQAKMFRDCCGLGPSVALADEIPDVANLAITMAITRGGNEVFRGESNTNQIARPLAELVECLFRANDFPTGAILLTGTGIVPPSDFTLEAGDVTSITIDGIGTLGNPTYRIAGA
jgi:2-dehydro-3-deoxy-D-arabinonate dehydratase